MPYLINVLYINKYYDLSYIISICFFLYSMLMGFKKSLIIPLSEKCDTNSLLYTNK